VALLALVSGILPNVPGFLTTINVVSKDSVWPWLDGLYSYAWFVGFLVSGFIYLLLMKPASKQNFIIEEAEKIIQHSSVKI
jgi:NCS1 family nucleobase:cation symporter-1